MLADEKSCEDIDECLLTEGTICSQICINSAGSYKCDCYKGYSLRKDEITCKTTGEQYFVSLQFKNYLNFNHFR